MLNLQYMRVPDEVNGTSGVHMAKQIRDCFQG